MIANIIRTHGISLEAINASLEGKPLPKEDRTPAQDPRVDKLEKELREDRQARQASVERRAERATEQFAASHEFYDDVREDMADILESQAKRGNELTLDEAYDRAVRMNPELSAVTSQRSKAEVAKRAKEAADKTRKATASVRTRPGGSSEGSGDRKGNTRRDDVAAAWELHNGRE